VNIIFDGLIKVSRSTNNFIQIELNNPPVNALSNQLVDELYDALNNINSNNQYKFLMITGLNKHFSAGADLKERASMSEEDTLNFLDKINSCFDLLEKLEIPTAAMIKGAVLGGGAELALCCDIIVNNCCYEKKNVKIGFPETTIGIIPGAGGTYRIYKKMNPGVAKYWILSGKVFSLQEALEDGFVDIKNTEDWDTFVEKLSCNSRTSLVAAKASMDKCYLEIDRKKQRLIELGEYKKTLSSPERKEALKKYKKK